LTLEEIASQSLADFSAKVEDNYFIAVVWMTYLPEVLMIVVQYVVQQNSSTHGP